MAEWESGNAEGHGELLEVIQAKPELEAKQMEMSLRPVLLASVKLLCRENVVFHLLSSLLEYTNTVPVSPLVDNSLDGVPFFI